MAQNSEVLICGEQEDGKITAMTKELLGAGKIIAEKLDGKLSALIVGNGIRDSAEEAIVYGGDKVYLIDDPLLSQYSPDSYTTAITQACEQIGPSVVLFGHTTIGQDVAGRVAYRLGCFPCMNCIHLDLDTDSRTLVQTRSVYGGNAIAVVVSKESKLQLATTKPRAMTPLEPDNSRKGEIENIEVSIDDSEIRAKLVSTTKEKTEGINLEEAKVIVAGGGGIGGAEGFQLLQDFAEIFGGSVGTTTVPFDEGWVPTTSMVVGDSGKTVKPDLYIAVGIRGASQHVAGCAESKLIVAINKDSDAGMFKVSDLGIVADYREILPPLIDKCRALLAT